jgi:hypothetical protein
VRPQRPARALFGALLVVASVAVALTVYSRVGDRREVLAVTRTVLAGEQLSDTDFKVVSISSDDAFPAVPVSDRQLLVGQYAKVRLLQDSLIVTDSVQAEPLVDPAKVLMSVPVAVTGVPTGLREGSRLVLIVTPRTSGSGPATPTLVEATVAAVPVNLGEIVAGGDGSVVGSTVALSIEVPPASAALVGSAEEVAVGVLDPDAPFPSTPGTVNDLDAPDPGSSVPGPDSTAPPVPAGAAG